MFTSNNLFVVVTYSSSNPIESVEALNKHEQEQLLACWLAGCLLACILVCKTAVQLVVLAVSCLLGGSCLLLAYCCYYYCATNVIATNATAADC